MGEKTNIYDLGNGVCIFCEFERAEEWCNNCATWLCRDCRRNSHSTLDERNHDVTSLDDVIQYQGVWYKICAKTTWNHLNEGRHLQKLDKILQFVQDDVEKGTEHITQQRARVSASLASMLSICKTFDLDVREDRKSTAKNKELYQIIDDSKKEFQELV